MITRTLIRLSGPAALILVLIVVLANVGAGSAAASPSCSLTSHCYGTAAWVSSPYTHGSGGIFNFHCLYSGNAGTEFTNEEFWQATDNSTNLKYWVESGGRYGWPNGDARSWFWADNRPNFGYSQHFPSGGVSLDTNYGFEIYYDGSDNWVIVGPGWSYSSVNNPPSGASLEAGTEITNDSARSVGNMSSMYYLDTSGNRHNGWSGAVLNPQSPIITGLGWVGSGNTELEWSTAC